MIDYGLGVRLAGLEASDCTMLREWRNDYRVYQHCRQRDLLSIAEHGKWYEAHLGGGTDDRMYSVIASRNTEWVASVGVCGLTNVDLVNRRAEFSLYIGPPHQKHGFAKAALKTLFSHGFNTYGFESIWGESYEGNPARKLFTNLGMKEDGIRRNFYYRGGKYTNAYLYSLLRSEWESSPVFENARTQLCTT